MRHRATPRPARRNPRGTLARVLRAALAVGVVSLAVPFVAVPAQGSFESARAAFEAAVEAAEQRDLVAARERWGESYRLLRAAQEARPGALEPHWAEVELYEFAAGLAADDDTRAEWRRRADLKRARIAEFGRRAREQRELERRRAAAQSEAFLHFQGRFSETGHVGERKSLSSRDVGSSTPIEAESYGGDRVAKKREEREAFEKVAPRKDATLRHEAVDPTRDAMDALSLLANTAIAAHQGRVNFNAIRENLKNFGKGDPNPYYGAFGIPAADGGQGAYPVFVAPGGPGGGRAPSDGSASERP